MRISHDVPHWNDGWYQDESPIQKCAEPWKMVHDEKSSRAVVCCHGYSGYPGELIRPGMDLYGKGFDVWAMRYSGHGTSGKDFLSSGREDWLGSARACLKDALSSYESVFLVGHSMGGLIAIILASEFPAVRKMALIAPALNMKGLSRRAQRLKLALLHPFVRRIKIEWKRDPAFHPYGEWTEEQDAYLGSQYWTYLYPPKLWDLYKLSLRAKEVLPTVEADTLSISGGNDESVEESSSVLATEKPKGRNRHLHISAATHLIPYDRDRAAQDEAMEAICAWFTQA